MNCCKKSPSYMPCWLSWLYFSHWCFHDRWCREVLSQAICQHSTFLDVTGLRMFVLCAHISEALLAKRLSLLYLHSISKLTLPYLQLSLTQLLKITIREKEDHVFLLLVTLALTICYPPNVIFQRNFLPMLVF